MSRLYLTGGICLEGPDGSIVDADLPGNQGRLVLAILAVEHRPVGHARMAELLWDDHPPERWKDALASVISKLRTLLTSVGIDGRDALGSAGGAYTLHLGSDAWIDVEDGLRRLDRAEGAIRHGDHAGAVADATVASAILRRPVLAGADGLWVERFRRRQTDACYRSLVTLADAWTRLGDHQLAATIAESAIQVDPLRELGHRLLITAEQARGDRAAALRALRRCELLLSEELGVRPSTATAELASRIRDD